MNPFSVEGKTILVTGASSGIGKSISQKLAEAGANLFITGRNRQRLEETFTSLHSTGKHALHVSDLTHHDSISELTDNAPKLDGIVHCAGILKPFPVKFLAAKHFTEINKVNYEAPVLLTASLLKAQKVNEGGSIVFISSVSSKFSYKGGALYTGTKAALDAFSRTLALEHASQKIRSNTINAGMVRTKIFDETQDIISSEMMNEHGKFYPLGFGEPEDIAHATLFLLSPSSRWITGTSIVMDGGLTAGT